MNTNSGWWRGQHGNKIGWFPSNYTQEELEDAHTYSLAENILDIMVRNCLNVNLYLCMIIYAQSVECNYNILKFLFQVALYTFKAQNDTELSFGKGERLEVIDRPPSDPDWYKARNTSGQIGLVPKNYLVELSQYLTQDVGKKSNHYATFCFHYKIIRIIFVVIFTTDISFSSYFRSEWSSENYQRQRYYRNGPG